MLQESAEAESASSVEPSPVTSQLILCLDVLLAEQRSQVSSPTLLGCSAMTQAFMENLQLEGALLPELVFTRPIAQEQLDPQELKRFIESALAELALPLPQHPEEAGRKTELAGNLVNCVLMGSGKLRLPQKEAEELLGTSLLAVVHCNSVDNVVPIIPAAPCLAIVVAAMRAG